MPDDSNETRLARVESLYNQGLRHAAAQLCRLVLEKDSSNIEALVWLAKSTSQPDEAEKAARRAANLQPDNPLVRELVAARPPVSQPGYAGSVAYNPYTAASPGYSPPPEGSTPAQSSPQPWAAFNQTPASPNPNSGFMPNPPSGFSTNQQSNSSYDYLKNLSATVHQPAIPPAAQVGKVKVKTSPSLPGLLFGLIFLIAGLALAVYWSWQVIDYTSDLSKTASQLQGQIVELSSTKLIVDVTGQNRRQFAINDQVFKSLEPLVSDTKNQQSLVKNQVVLNITPAGRLASVGVVTPNPGSAALESGLLGFGRAADWVVTALGGLLAVVGLILLGRTLGKRRT
jgi:hypothetical protein